MEQSGRYTSEGIEDSIRRCEELLALSPLAFETSCASALRRGSYGSGSEEPEFEPASKVDPPCETKNTDSPNFSAEKIWKRNMELLNNMRSPRSPTSTQKVSCASPKLSSKTDENSWSNCTSGNNSYSGTGSDSKHNSNNSYSGTGSDSKDNSRTGKKDYRMEKNIVWANEYPCAGKGFNDIKKIPKDIERSDTSESKETDLCTKGSSDSNDVFSVRIISNEDVSSDGTQSRFEKCGGQYSSGISDADDIYQSSSDTQGSSQVAVDGKWTSAEGTSSSIESGPRPTQGACHPQKNLQDNSFNRLKQRGAIYLKKDCKQTPKICSDADHNKQRSFKCERSKSLPKERGCKASKNRSRSVLRERVEDRLRTLSRPKTEAYKKLAEIKAVLEKEELQQCSFKPCVGRKPDPESAHSAPIFDRIMEIQQRIELRKRARKAYEKEELDSCSFWPRINWQSQALDKGAYQPIQERFQQLQKQKFEKLMNAQLRKNIGLTFKPEINPKSIQLCKQKGLEQVSVCERLSATHSNSASHQDCKQNTQGTFVPEINKNTDFIIASSKQFGGCSTNFLERQKFYLQSAEEKKKSKEQQGTPDQELTFRPDIGNSTLILKQSNGQDVLKETPLERFQRLAYKDKEHLFNAREKAAEAYYSQFQFQPAIDGFSRVLARSNSLDELYKNEKGKKLKEALEQAAKNDFQQKCPFRPELTSTSRKNRDSELHRLVMQRRQLRKERASTEQESRTLKELQELKECTFKPSVNPCPLKESAPATIKGLERHLELQGIAKQMKREHEELERKVFFSHAHTTPIRQYTIPRPFVLHTARCRTTKT